MKRFKTEEEIIALIERYRIEQMDRLKSSDETDALADSFRNTENAHQIEKLREQAIKFRKLARWREARIETLTERLAVIRTPMLPALDDGDTSIPSV